MNAPDSFLFIHYLGSNIVDAFAGHVRQVVFAFEGYV
jgi:hypothetical protein